MERSDPSVEDDAAGDAPPEAPPPPPHPPSAPPEARPPSSPPPSAPPGSPPPPPPSPPLGLRIHLACAAVLLPGGLAAALACGPADVLDGDAEGWAALALGLAAAGAMAVTTCLWYRRRIPFHGEPRAVHGAARLAAAFAAGAGIGAYGGALYDWIPFPAEWFVVLCLFPAAAFASSGDGFLHGLARVAAAHAAAHLAANGTRGIVVGDLGWEPRVTRYSLEYLPWTAGELIVWEAASRFRRRKGRPPRRVPRPAAPTRAR